MSRFAVLAVVLAACAPTMREGDRQTASIHHDIAISYLNQGDSRAALRELLNAVELDPSLAQAHNALGLVYHSMGHKDDALVHYRHAVQLKPSFSEAFNNLGVLLLDLERYDEAVRAFETALGDILYNTPSLAEGNLGWAYYKKGDLDRGLKHLRNAVATNPKFCRGYEWLARIGLEGGQPDQVVANVRRFEKHCLGDATIARTIRPEYQREMSYYLGMGYLKAGDREAAREALASCAAPEGEFATRCTQSLRTLD